MKAVQSDRFLKGGPGERKQPINYTDDPPQARATAVVRDILIGMIKSVQAARIIEDSVGVERVDLYYRPVYAFQYH